MGRWGEKQRCAAPMHFGAGWLEVSAGSEVEAVPPQRPAHHAPHRPPVADDIILYSNDEISDYISVSGIFSVFREGIILLKSETY